MFFGNKGNIYRKGRLTVQPGPNSRGAQGDTLGDAVAIKSTKSMFLGSK
jgi:hypothetical protein